MGKAPDASKLLRGGDVIKVAERMRRLRTRGNIKEIKERLTHQMRRTVAGVMHPDIDRGFAVVDRK